MKKKKKKVVMVHTMCERPSYLHKFHVLVVLEDGVGAHVKDAHLLLSSGQKGFHDVGTQKAAAAHHKIVIACLLCLLL